MSGDGAEGEAATRRPRLRRGLLGVRPTDVARELAARDAEIDEVRRELAALWQSYAQQDRAIRELLARPVEAPRPEEAERAEGDSAPARPTAEQRRAGIQAQLNGLDEALAAIEQATETLESAYRDPGPSSSPAGPPSDSSPTRARGDSSGEVGDPGRSSQA